MITYCWVWWGRIMTVRKNGKKTHTCQTVTPEWLPSNCLEAGW